MFCFCLAFPFPFLNKCLNFCHGFYTRLSNLLLYYHLWANNSIGLNLEKIKFTHTEHQIDLKYSTKPWFLIFELSLFLHPKPCVPCHIEITPASRKATVCNVRLFSSSISLNKYRMLKILILHMRSKRMHTMIMLLPAQAPALSQQSAAQVVSEPSFAGQLFICPPPCNKGVGWCFMLYSAQSAHDTHS